jgi:hypothetical protein
VLSFDCAQDGVCGKKGVVSLQHFAGGYNPDEDFKEKCQIDSLPACRQGDESLISLFSVVWAARQPGTEFAQIESSSVKKRFDWEKPYLGHSSRRRPEPERDERRCLLWH